MQQKVSMTLAQAKATLTPKGHRFDSLTDDELNAIINHPAATHPQKQAAGLVAMDNHAKQKAADESEKLKAKADSLPAAPPEVTPQAAFPPAPKAVPDGVVMSHLLEITQKLDRLTHLVEGLGVQVNTCADSSIAVTEQMAKFSNAFMRAVKDAPAGQSVTPSAGQNGAKPIKREHATRLVLEHKDGKLRVSFWNDDKPSLRYAAIYGTKAPNEWAMLIPWLPVQAWKPLTVAEWVKAFPDAKKHNELEFACDVFYTDSDNLNQRGNPYKDIHRIAKSDDF